MARRPRILVVEDVELNLDLMQQILEERYEVVGAADGEAGLRAAAETRPDLVLMDLSLPVLDGWEATRRLKQDPGLAAIPVIAVSSHAMQGDHERAFAAGCDEYLTKPLDEDLLNAAIERQLARRGGAGGGGGR